MSNVPMQRARCAAVLAAAVVLLLSACGGPPKPAQVSGTIEASTSVNPSISKRPSPVLVRVYELKTATAFNNADFVSLYQRDQAELGADMLGRDEFTLGPGESKPYAKTLSPETRFIGVFAAYRDLERSKWRTVLPVQPGKKQQIVIRAEELSVSATPKK